MDAGNISNELDKRNKQLHNTDERTQRIYVLGQIQATWRIIVKHWSLSSILNRENGRYPVLASLIFPPISTGYV